MVKNDYNCHRGRIYLDIDNDNERSLGCLRTLSSREDLRGAGIVLPVNINFICKNRWQLRGVVYSAKQQDPKIK